ncbi:MAG: cytochrome c-type biogenesis CcmF C-terminal domain-containing protein [Gemmatimonadaceae bacterium]
MILIGELSLWVALLMATWAATVSFAGGLHGRTGLIVSGERGLHAAFAMLALASLGLWAALIGHDFSVGYVALHTTANLPLVYTLAAFWGGPEGSLLFLALILASCSVIAVVVTGAGGRPERPFANAALGVVLLFFLAVLCFGANPYERIEWPMADGRGMHPRLQNPAMAIHPPILYLGLISAAVPFAFALGALFARRLDGDWPRAVQRWTLVSWLALSVGILLGMWWSYVEVGADGRWARDSVESWSLLAWLATGALLYSTGTVGKRVPAARWSVVLALAAFLFSLASALVSSGGMISSASSFAQSPIRKLALGFLALAIPACAYLLASRLRYLPDGAEPARASSTRRRRAIGEYVIYAGAGVILAGLGGQAFSESHDVTLGAGESRELRDPFGRVWTFTGQGVSRYNELNRHVVAAALDVARGGRSADIVTSEQRQYVGSRGQPTFEPSTEAGIVSSLEQDMYAELIAVDDNERATVRIGFNPLVGWIWIGGAIMVIGGVALLVQPARSEG